MTRTVSFLRLVDTILLKALKVITITCFILLTILVSANVFVRFVPVASLHWFDEIIELLYACLVFYGAAALWITKEHFSVGDWIGSKVIKNPTAHHIYRAVLEVVALGFAVVFFYYSFRLAVLAKDVSNVFAIPKGIIYACLPASGAIMIIYCIRNCIVELLLTFRSLDEEKKGG